MSLKNIFFKSISEIIRNKIPYNRGYGHTDKDLTVGDRNTKQEIKDKIKLFSFLNQILRHLKKTMAINKVIIVLNFLKVSKEKRLSKNA